MSATNVMYHLVWDLAPVAFPLCVVIGSVLVWRRTRRASALAQLIGAALVFIGWGLFKLRWSTVEPTDLSLYAETLRSETMRITMLLAPLIGLAVFSIGYLSYAVKTKRI